MFDALTRKRLGRLRQVESIVRRHLVAAGAAEANAFVHRRRDQNAGPAHVRQALMELGPTAIKIGQLVSSRNDLIPHRYQSELAKLRDQVAVVPTEVVIEVIERALGIPLAEAFSTFDHSALATASIGQVHAAHLIDGRRVAVKVRRPGIEASVEADLDLLGILTRFGVKHFPVLERHDVGDLYALYSSVLRSEMDYTQEARNAVLLAELMAHDQRVVIPKVYVEFTRTEVMVMDLLEGTSLSDSAGLDAAGVDRHKLALDVAGIYLAMVVGQDLFHADAHPGNLIALEEGRLGIVDFGEVGTVSGATRTALIGVVATLASGDADGLANYVLSASRPSRPVDRVKLAVDLQRLAAPITGGPLSTIKVGELLLTLMVILRRHGLMLAPDMALLIKTVVGAEATAEEIDPEMEPTTVLALFSQAQVPRATA